MSKELSVPKNTLKAWQAESGDDGFENVDSQDFQIPFLSLLQKGSPQVDEDKGEYVKGAKPGLFYDPATGELMEEAIVIPCHYKRAMVEWKPRETGGGFVAQHPVGYEKNLDRDEKGRYLTKEGNFIIDTRYFFCQRISEDGSLHPAVIAFTSSQIKKARTWMTRLESIRVEDEDGKKVRPPIFAHKWKLTSVAEQKDDYTWKGYKIEMDGRVDDDELFAQVKSTRQMFKDAENALNPGKGAQAETEGEEAPL